MRFLFLIPFLAVLNANGQTSEQLIRPYGVKINVTDMSQALSFYVNTLNFRVTRGSSESGTVFLEGAAKGPVIVLQKVSHLAPERENSSRAGLTLQVNNLDSTIEKLRQLGIDFGNYQKRKEGVGYAIYCDDPSGTRISFMHQTIVLTPHFDEPKIYNYGFYVPDMSAARKFYATIGFEERSDRYLPLDMPLNNKDKSFAFMLHWRENTEHSKYKSPDQEHIVILFQAPDLEKAVAVLKDKMNFVQDKLQRSGLGKFISFADASGYISEIVEVKD